MQQILVTDNVHEHLLESLKKNGYLVDYKPDIKYEDIFPIIHQYQGIVINSKVKMTSELMDLALVDSNPFRFIARLGSGLDIIDLNAAKERNIEVFSAPEGNRNAVAEHALGMLFALVNKMVSADFDVRNLQWNREAHRGIEIYGKSIGIIGFGNNGSCFAEKLAGLGVRVLAYDKYKENYAKDYSHVVECKTIQELIKSADIISLHIPLTKETHHMVDSNFLNSCKSDVILINTSRGGCVDTKAVLGALDSGKLRGVCLDVFENEKPKSWNEEERKLYMQLYENKEVILSPHVAGWTVESKYKIADSLLKQISNLEKNTI